MCDIKGHYTKQKVCEPTYSNENYEQLLYRLKIREHDYPLNDTTKPIAQNENNDKDMLEVLEKHNVVGIYTRSMLDKTQLPIMVGDFIEVRPNTLKRVIEVHQMINEVDTVAFDVEMRGYMRKIDQLNTSRTDGKVAELSVLVSRRKILIVR